MKRIFLLILIIIFLGLTGGYAAAQQPARKVPRIGILNIASRNPAIEAFREGLRELGWVEGKNIAIEYRRGDGNEDRLPLLAAQLVHSNVDIIVSTSFRGILAARQVTKNIPIVATFVGQRGGNLNHPEGNVTGLSFMPSELGGKRLELLKEIIPGISRVAVLANLVDPTQTEPIKEMDAVARSLRVQIQILNVKKSDEVENAFVSMVSEKADALSVLTQAMFVHNRAEIAKLARKFRLPAIYPDSRFTNSGGLTSYGPNNNAMYRRAAYFVDRILRGAKPSDLPVEQPTKFELVINLATAKALGRRVPAKVLTWADRVIE